MKCVLTGCPPYVDRDEPGVHRDEPGVHRDDPDLLDRVLTCVDRGKP